MKKLEPAMVKRVYENVFVCMKCKAKIRAQPSKVKEGKVKCRKCGSRDLRPKRKGKFK